MTMRTARIGHPRELGSRLIVHLTSAKRLTGASRRTGKVRSSGPHEKVRYSGRNCAPEDVLRLVVVAAKTCIHAFFAVSCDTAIPLGNASSPVRSSVNSRRLFEDSLIGIDRKNCNLQHDRYNRIHLREFKDPRREKSLLKSPVLTGDGFWKK